MIFTHSAFKDVTKVIAEIPPGGIPTDELADKILDALRDHLAITVEMLLDSAIINGLVTLKGKDASRLYPGSRHKELFGQKDLDELIRLLERAAGTQPQ